MLINKHKSVDLKHYSKPEGFTEYSNKIEDIYETIAEYNPKKKHKILIAFDNMIADRFCYNKHPVVTELFMRGRKLSISLIFTKNIRLNSAQYFIMKISNKKKL